MDDSWAAFVSELDAAVTSRSHEADSAVSVSSLLRSFDTSLVHLAHELFHLRAKEAVEAVVPRFWSELHSHRRAIVRADGGSDRARRRAFRGASGAIERAVQLVAEALAPTLRLAAAFGDVVGGVAAPINSVQELIRSELSMGSIDGCSFDRLLTLYFAYQFDVECTRRADAERDDDQEAEAEDDEDDEDEEDEHEDKHEDNDNDGDAQDMEDTDDDDGGTSTQRVVDTCERLRTLGASVLLGSAIMQSVFDGVSARIKAKCAGRFERPLLESRVFRWLERVVLPWARSFLVPASECEHAAMASDLKLLQSSTDWSAAEGRSQSPSVLLYSQWIIRLRFFVYERFATMRIDELFDIIVDYPDSKPALEDLRRCLQQTSLLSKLVSSLTAALKQRLLHAGATTVDIITQYVATIKVLRFIDPTFVSIDRIAVPTGQYLMNRDDNLRTLVEMLTEQNSGNEQLFELDASNVSEKAAETDPAKWQPFSTEVIESHSQQPQQQQQQQQQHDVFSMLINLYGNRESFVSEYRNMLADRLLSLRDYETTAEIRLIELLKLRFGEQTLQNCEIMLKDMADSKRLTALITPRLDENERVIEAIVMSYMFWPSFREEKLTLPEPMLAMFERFHKHFSTIKQARKLKLLPHLGSVDLDLELDDGSVRSFSVSPMHAAIIHHFQAKESWALEDLATELGCTDSLPLVRRRVVYWVQQGILDACGNDVYQVHKVQTEASGDAAAGDGTEAPTAPADEHDFDDDEETTAVMSASSRQAETWQIWENYVTNMLINFKSATLPRMHMTLNMFLGEDHMVSVPSLQAFLEHLINNDKIECIDGVYTLRKT